MQCIGFCLFSLLTLERQEVSHSLVRVLSQCAVEVGDARSFFPSLCQEQALTLSPGRPEHSYHVASAMRHRDCISINQEEDCILLKHFQQLQICICSWNILNLSPFSIRVSCKLSLNVLEATQTMKSMSGVSESLLIVAEATIEATII